MESGNALNELEIIVQPDNLTQPCVAFVERRYIETNDVVIHAGVGRTDDSANIPAKLKAHKHLTYSLAADPYAHSGPNSARNHT